MKKRLLRVLSAALILVVLALAISSCSSSGKTLLKLEANGKTYTYSVNLYELQLATVKGQLSVSGGPTINGHTALQDAFWDSMDEFDGKLQRIDDYYRAQILEECRYILIALCLFDVYDLSLSAEEEEEIDDYLNEFILSDGEGSKNKLNSILADYNINYKILREHCINSAKVSAVQEHLYSLLGNNIKQNYLEENYVHFDQLFLPNYQYVYVTDENGDEIYYNKTDNNVCYKKTDYPGTDQSGNFAYFTDSAHTHYSYDTENGIRAYKRTSDGSGYETVPMTDAELKALDERAELLYDRAQGVSHDGFALMIDNESEGDDFDDAYYLQKNIDYSTYGDDYYYLDLIMEKLEDADYGDVVMVESSAGYHIVMKLEHTDRAYELESNQTWFESSAWGGFTDALTQRVFREEAAAYYDQVVMDEEIYAGASTIKAVLPNFRYY